MRDNRPQILITLEGMAKEYASDEVDIARLADRAYHLLADDPSLLDGPDINDALFQVVRKIAEEGAQTSFARRTLGGGD